MENSWRHFQKTETYNVSMHYDYLGVGELKAMIFERTGDRTKVRPKDKLLTILRRYEDVSSSQGEDSNNDG